MGQCYNLGQFDKILGLKLLRQYRFWEKWLKETCSKHKAKIKIAITLFPQKKPS